MTPVETLLNAINAGDVAALVALLKKNPDVASARGAKGESPVLAAAYRGRQDLLTLLLAHAHLDIFEAAATGEATRVRELIGKNPACVNEYSYDGWTALHLACFFGHRTVAESLLNHHADLSAHSKNATANQPLHAALAGEVNPGLVRLLVESGADVNGRGAHGVTPLHLAASRGDAVLVEYLFHHGANPRATMDDGTTVGEIAKKRGHDAVSVLVKGY